MEAVEMKSSPEMQQLLVQLEASAPALTHTLKRIDELHKSGALDTLVDLAQVVQAAKSSVGDPMVHRLGNMVRVLGELGDTLITSGLPEKLPALMQAAEAARADAEADKSTLGVLGLLKALRQPDVQFTLKFLLALSRRVPEATK